jgi:hypothetical protein
MVGDGLNWLETPHPVSTECRKKIIVRRVGVSLELVLILLPLNYYRRNISLKGQREV